MTGLRAHRRDPALPARAGDVWLRPRDPRDVQRFVLRHLASARTPEPVSAELSYARWKPGTSLSCVYRVAFADGATRDVVVKRHGAGKAAELERRLLTEAPRVHDALALRPAAVWGDDAVWLVPGDPQLPGLPRAHDTKRAKRWLEDLGSCPGWRVRTHRSSAALLRYRPQTRAVLRWDLTLKSDAGERVERRFAVRALPPRVAARVSARRAALGELDGLPALLGHEARTGLLLEAWMPVEPFEPDDFAHAESAGALLARLHGAPISDAARSLARNADVARRRASLRDLFTWSAPLAERYERLPAPSGPAAPAALRWTHGDVHPDQFARATGDEARALLDLDRLAPGDPLDDLASWIADLLVTQPELDVARAMQPWIAGYTHAGGAEPPGDRLAAALVEALVQRAAAGLRRLQLDAEAHASALLDRALELAAAVECAP